MLRTEFHTGHDGPALVGMLPWLLVTHPGCIGLSGACFVSPCVYTDTCGVPEKAHVLAFGVWEQVGRNWRQTGFSEASYALSLPAL